MEKKILIFAATYNEADNINVFLENIIKLNINLDLLIVDDNIRRMFTEGSDDRC